MNIELELNKRLTKKGIYSNCYSVKESINHFTGYIFLSEKQIWTYIIDKIAYHKNDKLYTGENYTDYSTTVLEDSLKFYKQKLVKFSVLSRRLYTYSALLTFMSLSLYLISFKMFDKWIWLEQTGIGINLFTLIAALGVLLMSISFLLLPIREVSMKRYKNIMSVIDELLTKEIISAQNAKNSNSTYDALLNLVHYLYKEKKVDLDDTLLSLTQQTKIQDCFDFSLSQKNVTRLIGLMIHDKHMTKLDFVELQEISNIIIEKFTWKGKRFKNKSFGNALSDTLVTPKSDFKNSLIKSREIAQLLKADGFSFINQYWLEIG